MNIELLVQDFLVVASHAGTRLGVGDLSVEKNNAPHSQPTRLPYNKMAVYVFVYGERVLKVGKAGPKSSPRYCSQHYSPTRARSTLAASILKEGKSIGITGLTEETVGPWIKENTIRINFFLDEKCGVPILTLLEAFLQCRLSPIFEGFKSQRGIV